MTEHKLKMRFYIKCVDAEGEDVQHIEDMCEESTEIDWDTFKNYIDIAELEGLFPDYTWTKNGLQLWNDQGVTFYKSKYDGKECVYLTHSAIEYVFR